ncbi:MAG: hypothetical protein KKD83_00545 [Chloroflexi bacterium]|nr:hypothetical protein [Chloroflexota bacterium]
MIPTMVVWAEPIKSGDFDLAPNDIPAAIEWFREKTKQEPRLIILNPKNEYLAKEAGDSIRVMYLARVLTWEIWLSPEDVCDTPRKPQEGNSEHSYPLINAATHEMKMSTVKVSSFEVEYFRPRGRPKTYKKRELPEEVIKQLYAEGIGSKAIASRLKAKRGINVSYKTVQRVLSGKRVG